MLRFCFKLPLLFLFLISFKAYSIGVLTHEAIIDAEWNNTILPFLKHKYPSSTDSEFTEARAYAYGGAVTPDMGYYPFGSRLFTDLVHYVRSGDINEALLKDADSLNGLAFALGFLSHYYADVYGHPLATNISVPLIYKKMKKKFGDTVTYANNNISHIRMEFGFDVLQVAKGNYASKSYHDFIGFKVDTGLLAKAFYEKIYGLDLNHVFNNHLNLSVETFRFMIANVFPFITKTAWASKNKKLFDADSTSTSKRFRYKMHIRQYSKDFGTGYKRPGFFATGFSVIIKIMPKIGPLRALHFKLPNAQAEKYFDESFDTITIHYSDNLKFVNTKISLKDKDYDTGYPTEKCEYSLADETYNKWLLELSDEQFKSATPSIKNNIIRFYKQSPPPPQSKRYKECDEVYEALQKIKQLN